MRKMTNSAGRKGAMSISQITHPSSMSVGVIVVWSQVKPPPITDAPYRLTW
jgi:hypothetical protein